MTIEEKNKPPVVNPGDQSNPPNPAPEAGKGAGDKNLTEEEESKKRIEALKLEEQRMLEKVAAARRAARGDGDDLLGDPPAPATPPKDDQNKEQKPENKPLDPQSDAEFHVRRGNLKDALSDFIKDHPELKPENDFGNLRYSKLKEFLKISKDDISLKDFSKKLEGAYTAAFPDEVKNKAREEGKQEILKQQKASDSQLGETYSVRTASGETITLNKAEKEAAAHHPGGVAGYIKSKQAIAASDGADNKGYHSLIKK